MARHAYPLARSLLRERNRFAAEDGGLIIEVIVAALLVGMLAIGIFSALDAASARTGAIKSRAIAANVAQADQERMRAMEVSDVSNLRETYVKGVDGVNYTVSSRADWVTDASGTASCTTTTTQADYLKITSTVTWPAMAGLKPVVLTSVIAPPTGSFATNQGSLAVQVLGPDGLPVPGVSVTLSGPASFTETTNEMGCVLWGYLVAGSGYTVTLGAGCMDHVGNNPVTAAASVSGGAINAISMECGSPSAITATGDTQPRDTAGTQLAVKPAPLRWLTVANSGMGGTGTKVFGNGTPVTSLAASPLFPFTNPYAVYGGNCARERPDTSPNTGTTVMQLAPPGSSASVTVRQPAINVDVDNGPTQYSGATVTAVIDSVLTPSCAGTFTFTTNSGGQITDPGVPYGTYDLCASANVSGTNRKVTIADVPNTAPTGTTTRRFTITSASTAGTCP